MRKAQFGEGRISPDSGQARASIRERSGRHPTFFPEPFHSGTSFFRWTQHTRNQSSGVSVRVLSLAPNALLAGSLATSKEMVRFEREVELAASMDHPNIATVYESGVADGQPFLVMEYVGGKPLTEFLRENRIEIREAHALFENICRAVH